MDDKFEFGFIAQGIFKAICAMGIFVAIIAPEKIAHYMALILFLGFGLKPLIKITKLHTIVETLGERISEHRYRGITERRKNEITRKEHNEKYRRKRTKDPRLPKNW